MRYVCNCQGNRKRGYQGCFCNDLAFSAFQWISSKLVVDICALVVGSSGYRYGFPCGSLVRHVVTNSYPPLSLQGVEGHRVLELSALFCGSARAYAFAHTVIKSCTGYVLRISRIVCALAACNVCILQSMSAVHIQGSPVRTCLWHTGTPYTHYLSTNGAPTNPHITGR